MELTCPKCQGAMRTYERNGVHVDQCTDCRGIFLDRGEHERLVDAEHDWHGGGAPAPATPQAGQHGAPHPGQAGTAGQLGAVVSEVLKQARGGSQQHGSQHGYGAPHRKKKESVLSDLFG